MYSSHFNRAPPLRLPEAPVELLTVDAPQDVVLSVLALQQDEV